MPSVSLQAFIKNTFGIHKLKVELCINTTLTEKNLKIFCLKINIPSVNNGSFTPNTINFSSAFITCFPFRLNMFISVTVLVISPCLTKQVSSTLA